MVQTQTVLWDPPTQYLPNAHQIGADSPDNILSALIHGYPTYTGNLCHTYDIHTVHEASDVALNCESGKRQIEPAQSFASWRCPRFLQPYGE